MKFLRLTYLAISLLFLFACSTKKNTWVNRNFNNLTAHYNGYWSANEMMKEAETNIRDKYKDNYDKILPIFTYTSIEEGKTITPQMEKIFKKASRVIQYHSMLIRDREYNPNIKYNYLLIGKTHFHKHDYFAGLEAFEYVVNKNKRNPYKYEAMLWMLRTYNETGLFSSSQGLIDLIIDDKKKFPVKYKSLFNAIVADFYLKQEDYIKTIEFLETSFKLSKSRKDKVRYSYILAQLYQKLGNGDNAVKYYKKTLSYSPGYDMEFSATLNLAKSRAYSNADPKESKKLFLKMLAQEKYKEYRDQIYYSLAELSEKQKEVKDEEEYLLKSVKASLTNKNQKGLSSLKVGELYLAQAKYELAQAYYDTAVISLNKDFPDYFTVQNKQKSLKTLVGYMKTINIEDSLQHLSKLTLEQKYSIIDKIIADKKQKFEEEKKRLEEEKLVNEANKAFGNNPNPFGNPGGMPLGAPSAQWYFYNPATLSFGMSEFQKKWGNRKLEDNWRRSNKPVVVATETQQNAEEEQQVVEEQLPVIAPLSDEELAAKEREAYLKNIPTTPEQISASTEKIVDAYYNCGNLYKEQLGDYKNAIVMFEKLQLDYPNNKYNLVNNYQLYRLNLTLPDEKRAEFYKKLILSKYPDSEYAAIINNPEYNSDNKSSKNKEDVFYEETYTHFLNKECRTVQERSILADSLFPKSILKPKYALLKAMCKGSLENVQEMIVALKKVSVEYSNNPVGIKAKEMVEILEQNPNAKNADAAINKILFTKEDLEEHYYALQILMSVDLSKQKSDVASFIEGNFSSLGLKVDDALFDETKKLVLVKGFENAEKAMAFYNLIKENTNVIGQLLPGTYQQFIISKKNYTALLKNQKEYESYSLFFKKNYLKI